MALMSGGGGGNSGMFYKSGKAPTTSAPYVQAPPPPGPPASTAYMVPPPSTGSTSTGSVSPTYSAPVGGGGYGGGGGGDYGAGLTTTSTPPMDPAAYLDADSAYQQQLSGLKKAYADYLAQQGTAKSQYDTSYAQDVDTLGKNREQSLRSLEDDYASRGLLQSGLYADSLATTTTDFDKRRSMLDTAKANFLTNQSNDLTNFTSEQDLVKQRAMQAALANRTAMLGA